MARSRKSVRSGVALEAPKGVLDSTVRLVIMRFSFAKPAGVPASVWRKPQETVLEQRSRKARADGEQLLPEPVMNVRLAEFLDDIAYNYELVGAFHQPRPDKDFKMYQVVQFTFARKEYVRPPSENFLKMRDTNLDDLQKMCSEVMWRVRISMAPYVDKDSGDVMDDQLTTVVHLEVRTPLFNPDGRPVAQWQRNAAGEKVGDGPVPIQPDYTLRLRGRKFDFVPNTNTAEAPTPA